MATGSGAKRAAKNREVSLRKETEVQCGIVRLLYEDGSLSEKEYLLVLAGVWLVTTG
jgi:hypothetical protein